jgi:hypothetical protein
MALQLTSDGRTAVLQLLDELERTDPQSYKQLVAAMEQQLQAAGVGPGGAPTPTRADADSALLDMLKQTAVRTGSDISTDASPTPGRCFQQVSRQVGSVAGSDGVRTRQRSRPGSRATK